MAQGSIRCPTRGYGDPNGRDPYITTLKGTWAGEQAPDGSLDGSGMLRGAIQKDGKLQRLLTLITSVTFHIDGTTGGLTGSLGGPLAGGAGSLTRCESWA